MTSTSALTEEHIETTSMNIDWSKGAFAVADVRDAVMALELRLANLHVWGAELSLSQLRSEVRDEVSKHFPVFFDEEGGA